VDQLLSRSCTDLRHRCLLGLPPGSKSFEATILAE
jgi:hypothetical protein